MHKFAAYIETYFELIYDLLAEVKECIYDEDVDTAKNLINKTIYKLQELRRSLHDTFE